MSLIKNLKVSSTKGGAGGWSLNKFKIKDEMDKLTIHGAGFWKAPS
jgi:hypothetical protein